MESSGETPQKAAEDDIETNPRKLPQLRSLNPRGQRQVETTAPHFFMAMGDSHAEWHHKVAFTWRC